MFEKTRRRLTIIFTLIFAAILMVFTIVFYMMLSQTLLRNEKAQIVQFSGKMMEEINHHGGEQLFLRDERHPGDELADHHQFFAMADDSGQPVQLYATDPVIQDEVSSYLSAHAVGTDHPSLREFNEHQYAMMKFPLHTGGFLYIGEDVTEDYRVIDQMRWLLAGFLLLALLAAAGTGYYLSGRAMVPIRSSFKRQQDFTADASHELRTPLSVLHSSIEVLEEEKQLLPLFHQTVIGNMREEIGRMIKLTESLLTLARSDSGAEEMKREPVDLGLIAIDTVERFRPVAVKKALSLDLHIPKEARTGDFSLLSDPERLQQLLVLLMDNAIKYTPAGGRVAVELSKGSHSLILHVTDSGIGIPKEDLPYVFERFYRSDKARSRKEGGTGLGLSIAKWIVDAHHGTISVQSEPEHGSRFTVILPIR